MCISWSRTFKFVLWNLELLWTAPELLRLKSSQPYGTQKGDTYSFAIILYEIHGQEGPWGKTKYPSSGVYWPSLSVLHLIHLLQTSMYIFYINSERTLSHWRIFQLHTLMYKIVNFWHTWIIISNIHRNYPSCDVNSRRRSVPSWRKQVDVWSLHQAVYYRVLARESRVPAGLQVHQIPPQAYAARTVRNRRDNEFWVNV